MAAEPGCDPAAREQHHVRPALLDQVLQRAHTHHRAAADDAGHKAPIATVGCAGATRFVDCACRSSARTSAPMGQTGCQSLVRAESSDTLIAGFGDTFIAIGSRAEYVKSQCWLHSPRDLTHRFFRRRRNIPYGVRDTLRSISLSDTPTGSGVICAHAAGYRYRSERKGRR